MRKGKRGLSEVVVNMLIISIAILSVAIFYGIFISLAKNSSEKIETDSLNANIAIAKNSLILNYSSSRMDFSVDKTGNSNISYIQALVFSDNKSLRYDIFDIPGNSESETYSLNISEITNVTEIYVYPVFSNGKLGIGERKKIEIINLGKINENLSVINPVKNLNGCIPNWECSELLNCRLYYNLNNLLVEEMILKGEQTRICRDKNNCNSQIIERRECEDKSSVVIKKVSDNGKDYVEVYDRNNNLISKLEFISGEQNVLNIELPV